jgi:large subunit ribosomal protein L9
MVVLEQPIKALGLHDVTIKLHAEVAIAVQINVARTEEEAERQAKGEDVIQAQMDADRGIANEANAERAEIAKEMFEGDFGDDAISENAGDEE